MSNNKNKLIQHIESLKGRAEELKEVVTPEVLSRNSGHIIEMYGLDVYLQMNLFVSDI